MALLTPLPLDAARALGALYGVSVAAVRGLREGSVNSNFELTVDAADGTRGASRMFLRIYEESSREQAKAEGALLTHLARRGVPTPTPCTRIDGGGMLAEHAGKPVALFPWMEGAICCQAVLRPDHLSQVGAAVARIHLAGADLPPSGLRPSRFTATRVAARMRALEAGALPDELRGVVARLRKELETTEEPPTDGLIHGDLFRDNALWQNGRLAALLDFESASGGSFAFDIAVTMLAWCFGSDLEPALVRALLGGYGSVRALTADDRAWLYPAARLAALRFTATRIEDFELRPREAGVYKDYRRFLARRDALDRLGPAGLAVVAGLPNAD